MGDRAYNEERYKKQKLTGDDLHNAAVCNQIADESLEWNPNEAVYWRKLAIEHAERCFGKDGIENAAYYERLANDYLEKPSFSQALKWNSTAKKIKAKQLGRYAFELLENELFELQTYWLMYKYDELPNVRERIRILLEKHPHCEEAMLYKAYLKMAQYKERDGNFELADAAMGIAEKVYGKASMETAEIYRIKAIEAWQSAKDQEHKEEAAALNSKAYDIATHAKDNGQGSRILSGIQRNMQVMRVQGGNPDKDLASEKEDYDSEASVLPDLEKELKELYEKGNQLEKQGRYDEALREWQKGYTMISANARLDTEMASRFLAAIGDIYYLRKNMYQKAYECFDAARGYGGYGNSFIMLRLGECCLELGDERNAVEYLMRAWMMEGEEIFEPDENGEDDGGKYFRFLREHVDLDKNRP